MEEISTVRKAIVFIRKEDRVVQYMNDYAEDLFNISLDSILGDLKCWELFRNADSPCEHCIHEQKTGTFKCGNINLKNNDIDFKSASVVGPASSDDFLALIIAEHS